MSQVSGQITVAAITAVAAILTQMIKTIFEARQRHKAITQDLNLLDALPLDSTQRDALQTWIDEQVKRYIMAEREHKRNWFEVVLGLIFLVLGVVSLWTIAKFGGWGWGLVFVPVILMLFGFVGFFQGVKKTRRDENGNVIKILKNR